MRIYIISGEQSGDLHGANLITEIIKLNKKASVRAFGGDKMKEAGAIVVKHINDLSFMGIFKVIFNLKSIKRNLVFCKKDILLYRPDFLILIDYPGFNLKIAKFAKNNGIKVFYYISPKIWAWKRSRVKLIKKYVDEIIVIFPFEVEFFDKYGITARYFGSPIYDEIKKEIPPLNISKNKKIIALLPGSRYQEIEKNLPVMIQIVSFFPDYRFVIATTKHTHSLCKRLSGSSELDIIQGQTYSILKRSEAALVTSGTATLEAALLNVPQIVCYKTDFLTYYLGKILIRIEWISLVNIIMNRGIVNELIQSKMHVGNLKKELEDLLSEQKRHKMLSDYKDLQIKLNSFEVSKKIAEFILTND